jgi:hypothetical protein
MKNRLIASTAALIALAGLAVGCSESASTSAAKVDGSVIDDSTFTDDLQAYSDNTLFQAQQPTGAGGAEGTVSNQFARTVLRTEILFQLVSQEVASRGLDTSTLDPTLVEQQTWGRFSSDGSSAVFTAFPKSFQERELQKTADVIALQQAYAGAPTDAALQAEYDKDPRRWGNVCASHILVATEDEAKAVKAQLDAGADFATVAASTSTDQSAATNGGSLTNADGSCMKASTFVPEFVDGALAATVGEPSQPVQTQFGWHIIKVDKWEPVPFDEAKADIQASLANEGTTALSAWLTSALKGDIWVNPRYGTWDPNTSSILEPGSDATSPASVTTTQG